MTLRLGVLAMLLAGCASRYTPQRSPRVQMVWNGTNVTYVREGRTIDDGLLGGGLVDAVAGDPEAEDLAESYTDRKTAGFVVSVASAACVGIVPLMDPSLDDLLEPIGFALVCMTALSLTGASLMASAIPFQYDAVNVFNDHLELRLQRLVVPRPPAPATP